MTLVGALKADDWVRAKMLLELRREIEPAASRLRRRPCDACKARSRHRIRASPRTETWHRARMIRDSHEGIVPGAGSPQASLTARSSDPELQQAKADFIEAVISRKYRAAQAANALSPNMRDLNLRRRRLSVRSATRLW